MQLSAQDRAVRPGNEKEHPMANNETYLEPAKEIPVYRKCDVLIAGGGPAGCAAAAAAAQMGADTILVERYGHLGGMSTGGLVVWIDRMTDWDGKQVIAGFANELLGRVPEQALLSPPRDIWGKNDNQDLLDYWNDRWASFHGTITWSPTIDPEILKIAHLSLMEEKGVNLLLHAWAVAPIQDGDNVRGVIFESKSGRQAILADNVIDATGDGDIFALAGEEFESDIVKDDNHHRMNVAFLWDGTDMQRYLDFRRHKPDEFRAVMKRGQEIGVRDRPMVVPGNDKALFMGPRLTGYSCIDVEDLTSVEILSRKRMMIMLDFYRDNMPGFENARVMQTASQMGVRHSRRMRGVTRMERKDWISGKVFDDEIGLSPPPSPRHPNVSIPFGCILPVRLDNLIAAGRNLSSDPVTHIFMREIPNCWALGQAAGIAAVIAQRSGVRVRDVDIRLVQDELIKQGAALHTELGGSIQSRHAS